MTAPISIEIADLPFEPTSLGGETGTDHDSFRSWWPSNEQKPDWYDIQPALKTVRQAVQENGPFDGVIGFSQGAGFAGILCNAIANLDQYIDEKQEGEYKQQGKPFKFGIFYSGFRVKPEALQHFYTPPISTKTLHILGSLDTVVSEERSMKLFDACDEKARTMLKHPGGHFVPNSKPLVNSVLEFIAKAEKEQESTTEEESKEEKKEDLDDLFSQIGKV